jgi:hypothetical protein
MFSLCQNNLAFHVQIIPIRVNPRSTSMYCMLFCRRTQRQTPTSITTIPPEGCDSTLNTDVLQGGASWAGWDGPSHVLVIGLGGRGG